MHDSRRLVYCVHDLTLSPKKMKNEFRAAKMILSQDDKLEYCGDVNPYFPKMDE